MPAGTAGYVDPDMPAADPNMPAGTAGYVDPDMPATTDPNMPATDPTNMPAGTAGTAGCDEWGCWDATGTYTPHDPAPANTAGCDEFGCWDAQGNYVPHEPTHDPAPQTSEAWNIINDCDQDGDFMLTKEEGLDCIKKARKADNQRWGDLARWVRKNAGKHDADGNEKLDEFELQAAMDAYFEHQMKQDEAKEKAEQAIRYCDTDADDEISHPEAEKCLATLREYDPTNPQYDEIEDNLNKRWNKIDKDGNGTLNKKELAREIIRQGY